MLCSVIVPVYNGESTIIRCLDGLALQLRSLGDFEIVVINDGSTDQTLEVVEQWRQAHQRLCCKLVQQENAGPAAARNHGAEVAHAPILLFTDADCVPASNWIEQMLLPFDDEQVVGVKGVYLSDQTGLVPQFVQAEYEDRYDRMRRADSIDFIDTYSAGYRRAVFLENGGFDPIFPTASVEDQEFSFRLAEKGYRLVFAPDARVGHLHDESVREYARRKYYIGYWKALVTQRHPQRIIRDSHTPQVLKVQIAMVAGLLALMMLRMGSSGRSFQRLTRRLAALDSVLFLASAAPFLAKLVRRSWLLGLVGPFMLAVRALALGCGYAVGMIRFGAAEQVADVNADER